MPRGYRKRIKQSSKKMELMRKAKDLKRIEDSEPVIMPFIPPLLRRKIIIIDYDFGEVEHEINCYRSGRIDSYEISVDGEMLDKRMGWSAVCNLQRQAFVRVGRFD